MRNFYLAMSCRDRTADIEFPVFRICILDEKQEQMQKYIAR